MCRANQLVRLRGELLRQLVAGPLAVLQHEHVRAERLALDHGEEDGALVSLDRLRDPVEDRAHSSSFSTKTSISPPQGSPTAQPSSSEMP